MNQDDIQGWYDFDDFYQYAASCMPMDCRIVELGPWLGKSTVGLANALKKYGKTGSIVAVDTWDGSPGEECFDYLKRTMGKTPYGAFLENIEKCGVADAIRPIKGSTLDVVGKFNDGHFHFCFFDTAHTYEHLKAELAAWIPKVVVGGILAGHDYAMEGVSRAVKERFSSFHIHGPCWWTVKPE